MTILEMLPVYMRSVTKSLDELNLVKIFIKYLSISHKFKEETIHIFKGRFNFMLLLSFLFLTLSYYSV